MSSEGWFFIFEIIIDIFFMSDVCKMHQILY
jgi:hypothetical protein